MKTLLTLSAPFLAIAVVFAGCQKPAATPPAKTYAVKGMVVSIDLSKETVVLDHEDIPGLMQAMEMAFKVADPAVLKGIATGDRVGGQLEVRSGDYVLTALSKE